MEEKNTTMGTTETMEDYKEALEASYRRIRPGDIVTGTVIDVNDQDVTIDFNYYAPGRIPVTELSDDPTYHVLENVAVGDTLTATVVKTDDGAGNMLLSCKDAAEELAWDKLQEENKEGLPCKGGRCCKWRMCSLCRRRARIHPGIEACIRICRGAGRLLK